MEIGNLFAPFVFQQYKTLSSTAFQENIDFAARCAISPRVARTL
jgi:hypothetical protein